jgi:hypothetical protein
MRKPKKPKESPAVVAAKEKYQKALAAATADLSNETIRKLNKALQELETAQKQ